MGHGGRRKSHPFREGVHNGENGKFWQGVSVGPARPASREEREFVQRGGGRRAVRRPHHGRGPAGPRHRLLGDEAPRPARLRRLGGSAPLQPKSRLALTILKVIKTILNNYCQYNNFVLL